MDNEWEQLKHNIKPILMRNNNNFVELREEWSEDYIQIKPARGESADALMNGLRQLDAGSWIIGLDYMDLRKCFFVDDNLESLYFHWNSDKGDDNFFEEISDYLDSLELEAVNVFIWALADMNTAEFADRGYQSCFDGTRKILQILDCEADKPAIYVIVQCKPNI